MMLAETGYAQNVPNRVPCKLSWKKNGTFINGTGTAAKQYYPVAVGHCRVVAMAPSLLWDRLCMVLTLTRRGQVSLVACPGNRLRDRDLHEES